MDWEIKLITSGGITGIGNGSVVITRELATAGFHIKICQSPLTPQELAAVDETIAALVPSQWREQYVKPANPRGYADQVRYDLSVEIDTKKYATRWYDESMRDLPDDLEELNALVVRVRNRLLLDCPDATRR